MSDKYATRPMGNKTMQYTISRQYREQARVVINSPIYDDAKGGIWVDEAKIQDKNKPEATTARAARTRTSFAS